MSKSSLKGEKQSTFETKQNSLPKPKFKYIAKAEAVQNLKPEIMVNLDKLDKPEKLNTTKS